MNRVVLLLGSNIGDRLLHLENAIKQIRKELGEILLQSSVYETSAWGNTDQDSFLNRVVLISSTLTSDELMNKIIRMEEEMGRKRNQKWEPRIIDIDILFFNDELISTDNLTIPHPGIHLRKFTLMPLAEIMPDYIHPKLNKTISVLLNEVNDPLAVKKISANFA